jgi:sporulation integral membrane protein YlbJ
MVPGAVFEAAQNAVTLWATTLVPSMLPFFILNEMLTATGGIALLGKLLEKPVQRLLKLPGEAGFVLATGYSAGVPVSAVIIADLRRQGRLTRRQGNRLLPFAANVSPIFILSAVAVSMLNAESCGAALAIIHYGSNLFLGILVSLFAPRENMLPLSITTKTDAPKETPFLSILTNSIFRGLKTMCLIGGLVLIFFILIALCKEMGLFHLICRICQIPYEHEAAATALFSGILEITAGTNAVTLTSLGLPMKLALISGILAFGGISAMAQIASQLKDTDLSIVPYFFYKIIQGVLAFTVSLFFPMRIQAAATLPVAEQTSPLFLSYFIALLFYALFIFIAFILLLRRAGKR